ncbi:hypothetical protein [Pseudothermotoga thermarum]|uniref:hypothetical protein n=1 Tax=Pseudothermotoga thermarum TaxID=119394 RepID=UPI0002EEC266|nr:hypothetical protein [Pseudothermotoga thermarum]
MAYKFKCINCGDVTFSASALKYQKSKNCEKCGGKIIQIFPPLKLGEILLELESITKDQLEQALAIQQRIMTHVALGKILLRLGYINQSELEKALKLQQLE